MAGIDLLNRPIWICQKHRGEFGVHFWSEPKQWKECVVNRGDVTPEIDQAIPPRHNLVLKLLFRKRAEELVNAILVELPRLQSPQY